MRYRKALPDVSTLYEFFKFDFENGQIWRIKDYRGKPTNTIAWHLSQTGYACVILNNKVYFAHRLMWKAYYKEEPPEIIDHINEDKLDNRISNLQKSNRADNKTRSSKVRNLSGFRGVYKRSDRDAYEVRVSLNYKLRESLGVKDIHVGYYIDLLEAAAAYNLALDVLGFDANYRNVVDFNYENVDTNKTFFKNGGGLSLESI